MTSGATVRVAALLDANPGATPNVQRAK